MDKSVFKSLLAMDSYNRGYNSALSLPDSPEITEIGNYTLILNSSALGAGRDQSEGFYATAYQKDDEVIISYRGTDSPLGIDPTQIDGDLLEGWVIGAGNVIDNQTQLAFEFYDVVSRILNSDTYVDPRIANISLTGHSLGGGLAGLVAGAYGKDALVVANMPWENALTKIYLFSNPDNALVYDSELRDLVYGGALPWSINEDDIIPVAITGEVLTPLRVTQLTDVITLSMGPDVNLASADNVFQKAIGPVNEAVARHDAGSHTMILYANTQSSLNDWEASGQYFWPVMFNDEFAGQIGVNETAGLSGTLITNSKFATVLRMMIAYSVIDEADATKIFGDKAVASLFNDANDFGSALTRITTPKELANISLYGTEISKVLVEYAGKLALNKIEGNDIASVNVKEGAIKVSETFYNNTLTLDFTDTTWAIERQNDANTFDTVEDFIARGDLITKILNDTSESAHIRAAMNNAWGNETATAIDRVIFALNPFSTISTAINAVDGQKATLILPDNMGSTGDITIIADENDTMAILNNGRYVFQGGSGNDVVYGGAYNNVITFGAGRDLLAGYVDDINGDTITDLEIGDGISLRMVGHDLASLSSSSIKTENNKIEIDYDGDGFSDVTVNATLPENAWILVEKAGIRGDESFADIRIVDGDVYGYGITSDGKLFKLSNRGAVDIVGEVDYLEGNFDAFHNLSVSQDGRIFTLVGAVRYEDIEILKNKGLSIGGLGDPESGVWDYVFELDPNTAQIIGVDNHFGIPGRGELGFAKDGATNAAIYQHNSNNGGIMVNWVDGGGTNLDYTTAQAGGIYNAGADFGPDGLAYFSGIQGVSKISGTTTTIVSDFEPSHLPSGGINSTAGYQAFFFDASGQMTTIRLNAANRYDVMRLDVANDDKYTIMDFSNVGINKLVAFDAIGSIEVDMTPVAQNDSIVMSVDGDATGNIFADNGSGADYDPNAGDTIQVFTVNGYILTPETTFTTDNGGALTVSQNGDFSYVAAEGFVGVDRVKYEVQDDRNHLHIQDPNQIYDDRGSGVIVFDVREEPTLTGDIPIANNDFYAYNAGAFVYRDDVFGTNEPGFAKGGASSLGNEYFLTVTLGDQATGQTTSNSLSGAHTLDFNLDNAGAVTIEFDYKLLVSNFIFSPLNTTEHVDLMLALDGAIITDGANSYFDRQYGVSNTHIVETEWRSLSVTLDDVSAGAHQLAIGGLFSSVPFSSLQGDIWIDNVYVSASAEAGGVPYARDDEFDILQNEELEGNVLHNNGYGFDYDDQDASLNVRAATFTTANGGDVELNGDGTFIYTPFLNYYGSDSFTYTVYDSDGNEQVATVTIYVADKTIYGTASNDQLLGTDQDDIIFGEAGIDTLKGFEGNDTLYGGEHQDYLYGGSGDDTLYADGLDFAYGGIGNDVIHGGGIAAGDEGDDTYVVTTTQTTLISILDVSEYDVIVMPETYSIDDVTFFEDEQDLLIYHQGNNIIRINDHIDTGAEAQYSAVEEIRFADGVYDLVNGVYNPYVIVPTIPTSDLALDLSGGLSFGTIADSADINTGAQDKKTHSMSFATSADVTSTQVLYEQGGSTRGLNFVITGGTLFAAVWNNAEENWGYKELQVGIEADTFYTATLVMDGQLPTDGSATLYLNGEAVDTIGGVGRLYSHGDNIGIGQTAEGTLVNGVSTRTAYTFTGSIEKLAHYNAALSGEYLDDLHDYMAYEWLIEEPVNTNPIANDDSFVGDENLDITGNVLANDGDIDGDAISVSSGTYATAQGGSITLQSNGDFTYTPLAGFFGNDSVSYTLNDARGGTDTATINFVVNEEIISGPELPSEGLAVIEEGGVTFGGRADSSEINLISTLHKTQSVSFETGADITSTQVIYEQGGGVRGLNMFVEGGKVYAAVWNNAEENWGYHELEFDVLPNTKYVATFVMDGALPADGSISFYLNDEAPVTSTGIGNLYGHSGDIGVGMTPDNTRIHNAVTSGANTFTGTIEKWAHYNAALSYADVQQLHDYMGEGWLDQAPIEDIVMEFGSVSTNHNEVTVDLDNSFDNPVVFVTMTTFNGNQVAVARVTDVQSDSFTFYAQEADYLDGAHATETFSYIVAEAGSWVLSDGTKLEVGTHDTNQLHRSGFDTIAYDTDFAARPTILTQVQTDNDVAFVSTRFKGANDTSFQLALQEEEISASGSHGSETIGWMAIEQGAGSDDGYDFFAGVTGDSYTHAWQDILFDDHLDVLPQLLANISSNDGADASFLRADNLTTNSVSVSIQEDQSKDEEVAHTTESIDFFAIEGQGQLTGLINSEIV